jgi:SAM-dependent methyltransferase
MSEHVWWKGQWRAGAESITLSIIVPVYNERYLVRTLLGQLDNLEIEGVSRLDIVVVDDGSTDGSLQIVEEFVASRGDRFRLIRRSANGGKGAAIRTGIDAASGDLIVIQDADLEYDPRDFSRMVRPFLEDGADVVYGSRFAAAERRRVLYFLHQIGNRIITFASNLFTDLNLTDVETCYKMIRAPILKSLPLRSNDFAMEIEITAKLAKRRCVIYEVPISYRGRTYQEGKKIGWRDGFRALYTILKYWLIDDLYRDDDYGRRNLRDLERTPRFNRWISDALRPWVGARVLEVRAGLGNLTLSMIPRDLYVATDVNPNYLHYLQNFAAGKPYLRVDRVDVEDATSLESLHATFDTVICFNVLEHVDDPVTTLANLLSVLEPEGRLLIYVPHGSSRYSSLDAALGNRRRYDRTQLESELQAVGFELERTEDFNRLAVPVWWWNGKVLKRNGLGRLQLKILDMMVPALRRLDRLAPWTGLALIAIARKPDTESITAS